MNDEQPNINTADGSTDAEAAHSAENPDVRDLSFGKVVAYIVGGSTIFFALIDILQHPIAVVSFLLAGLFALPSVRSEVEAKIGFSLARWRALFVYLAFLLIGGIGETIL